jgi:LPS sulfotransferase NodH
MLGGRVRDYGAFALAVRAAGSTANGVFAARVMWGSVERVIEGLAPPVSQPDVESLEEAFGPLAFIHLTRQDVVAQAVSWVRAEQTGYWHHGDTASPVPKPDLPRMADLVEEIYSHNALWKRWFATNHIQPHRLTYEALTRDPAGAIASIASHLGVAVPEVWRPESPHGKQADQTNAEWSTLLRASLDSKVE